MKRIYTKKKNTEKNVRKGVVVVAVVVVVAAEPLHRKPSLTQRIRVRI